MLINAKSNNNSSNLEVLSSALSAVPSSANSSDHWQNFVVELKVECGEEIFEKWLSKIELYSLLESEIVMSAPSKFLRDWIAREYIDSIKKIWKNQIPTLRKFSIIHIENTSKQNSSQIEKAANKNNIVNISKYDNVFSLGTDLNSKFTFDNFVVGKSNQLAVMAAKIMAGEENSNINPSDVNPLFLYGGVGLGKTHLGQAIAWHTKENNKKVRAIYLSAERFMHQFVQSIRSKDVVEFKEKFRSIDLLIIDDLQFIIGKEGTQEELLYTISNLVGDNKKVILICDRSPGDLNNVGDKLRSRMSAGMVADFKCPDYASRLEILNRKSINIEPKIPTEVLELLANNINSSIRDLEGALKKLMFNQISSGENINLQSANSLLQDLFRTAKSDLSIADIKKAVGHCFSVNVKDLDSASRSRKFARPRQISMYLSKILTTKSLAEIGDNFGGKNHATVIHAVKTVEKLMAQDLELASEVRIIEESLTK
ncbi:MAG: chromosomal replication initiator protein [Rickettsiales bacterium]|jgi:chromosomal replication initiator protein